MTRKTPFVSVNLTPDARETLRQATLDFSATAGRRLSMADVVTHAIRVARQHPDEIAASLRGDAPPKPARGE